MPPMPPIMYGTAWKKDLTAQLVKQAIGKGFRGIDTACQPKHYNEKGVGEGIKASLSESLTRDQLFIQTKFTPLNGQDPNDIPYDKNAPLREQVQQSIEKSKENLATDYLDSLVLHSPLSPLSDLTAVWEEFELAVRAGHVKQIGICNCYDPELFKQLYQSATIKPRVLQNRFYEDTKFDIELRKFCQDHDVAYQSFWTLSANPRVLGNSTITKMAKDKNKTPAQVFFRYLTQIGITPLTGTTSSQHMDEDLAIFDFSLNTEECQQVDRLGPFS